MIDPVFTRVWDQLMSGPADVKFRAIEISVCPAACEGALSLSRGEAHRP